MPTFSASNPPVIGDLVAASQRLEVWCCNLACHREVLMPPDEAVRLLGANTTFPDAQRKLRCAACGARGRDGLIRCRGSIVDFYASLAANHGLPMPTHQTGGEVFPLGAQAPASRPTHRRGRRRGGW